MKPLKIVMQAFGPYQGREEIDFSELSKAGIFLIKGPTGSGKTTIFDAMSMALYGKSTGEDDKSKSGRNKLEVWRCNQAKSSDETVVEFTFEADGRVYRFSRRLVPKRVKLDQVNSLCRQDEQGIFQVIEENPKDSVMNAEAEKLIGLNSNQFRQVVLLPQGQFERFLTADSSEKELILSRLFDVNQWGEYALRIFEKANKRKQELADEKSQIEHSLSEEESGFGSLDELDTYIETKKEELQKLEADYKEFNVSEKQALLEKDKTLSGKYEQLKQLIDAQQELKEKNESIREDTLLLAAAEKAEKVREPICEVEKLFALWRDKEANLNALKEKTEEFKTSEKTAKEEQEKHKKNDHSEEFSNQIAILGMKREKYEKLDALKSALVAAERDYEASNHLYEKCEKSLMAAKVEAAKKLEERNGADDRAKECRNQYFSGIYGAIAAQLVEDTPCPVCGSKTHPSPAIKSAESVSKEMVEEADKKAEDAKRCWEKAEENRKQEEAKVKEAETALKACEINMTNAKNIYDENHKDLIEGIDNVETLDGHIVELTKKIEDYNEEAKRLELYFTQRHDRLNTHIANVMNAEEECENAKKIYEEQYNKLIRSLKEYGYDGALSAKNDQLSPEERKRIQKNITEYATKVEDNQAKLTKQYELLEGTTAPDSSLFEQRQKDIDDEKQRYTEVRATIENEIIRLSNKSNTLHEKNLHYENNILEAESDFSFAKALRGDTGIGLQRYVLGIMFDQIIVEANRMLQMVHGGRYQLHRTDEKGNGNKRGLELLVKDNRTPDGKERPVTSLSGGEKFLVSLSLSIGMSSVAQKSGLHIEALFIDEGFGTLDEESISDAMVVLEHVQRSSGMIGIISHVSILESTIPKHIEIIKTNSGSSISLC